MDENLNLVSRYLTKLSIDDPENLQACIKIEHGKTVDL